MKASSKAAYQPDYISSKLRSATLTLSVWQTVTVGVVDDNVCVL